MNGAEQGGLPADATPDARRLEQRRDRTSELELLITGAVLFALFQLVRVTDESFVRLFLQLGGTLLKGAIVVYEYTKLILYTSIVTFVAHLALRAWWVGLVGIDTVFPGGPRWERLRYGPAALEAFRQELPPVRRLLLVADTLASVVFAAGIALAAVFLFSLLAITVLGAAAWTLSLAVPALSLERVFVVVALLVIAASLLVTLVDRLWGARLLASRRAPLLRRAVRWSSRVAGGGAYLPITLVLASNLPKRRLYAGFALGLVLVLSLFIGRDLLFGLDMLSLDSHRYLPAQPASDGFDPHYYESYRRPFGDWRLPSIPAEVVTGPYLRLFVPLLPERVDRGVRALCPSLRPARQPGLHLLKRRGEVGVAAPAAPLRDCLLRLQRIELDGRPLPPESFLLGVHPVSAARGLMAQLPASGLAAGEHRLVVEELPLPGSERRPRRHVIRFWR